MWPRAGTIISERPDDVPALSNLKTKAVGFPWRLVLINRTTLSFILEDRNVGATERADNTHGW
jgi:hypothetical protein